MSSTFAGFLTKAIMDSRQPVFTVSLVAKDPKLEEDYGQMTKDYYGLELPLDKYRVEAHAEYVG